MFILLSILSSSVIYYITSNNFVYFILSFIYGLYIYRFKYSKREHIISNILGLIISFIINCYINLNTLDTSNLTNIYTILHIIGLTPLISYTLLRLNNVLKYHKYKDNKLNNILFKNSKYSILRYFLIIFICWLPIMIIFYPGVFSYDAAGQLNQFATESYTNHHPMIHTLFLSLLVDFGDNVFNSSSIGLYIHAMIQAVIFALSLSYIIDFISKDKAPFIIKIITLLSFSFLPIMPVMAVTITKDVLFGSFYVIMFINIIKLIKYKEKFFNDKINVLTLIVFTSLSILFRNNALYALVLFIPFVLIYLKKYIKKLIPILISIIVIVGSFNITINTIYKPENGSIREALSLPIQFMGRLMNYEDLTDKESENIQYYFSDIDLQHYNKHISDPIKNTASGSLIAKEPIKFVYLTLKLALKYPTTLIDSTLLTNESYFNPLDEIPDHYKNTYRVLWEIRDSNYYNDYDTTFRFQDNIIFKIYYVLLESGSYNDFPVLKFIFNLSIYIYLLIFTLYVFIIRKSYDNLIAIIPMITLFITAILGPVAILRYILPIVLSAPILINLILKK